jgi:hypothetical protein|tara:strand:- start:5807 stop:5974 length:168 start_codon:yes stop_codon:yes gene_type:complete
MTELIKHALGFCGEHWHPNLFTLLAGGFGLSTIISCLYLNLRCKINRFIKSIKKY